MEIPVLVERVAGNGYCAKGGEPFAFSASGATAEEALQKFQEMIQKRIATGASLFTVQVPTAQHPLASNAGWLRDDPMFEAWKQAMADYRRERDSEPDLP